MAYAENTSVSVGKSKAEIESVLERYGATGFGYMVQGDKAMVMFEANDRRVRFILPLPNPNDPDFWQTPTGRQRKEPSQAYDQEVRRRWRALCLAIKAKLEAVETGIASFEEEFLAHIVMPNGQTVAETAIPAIDQAYQTNEMRPLLEHVK